MERQHLQLFLQEHVNYGNENRKIFRKLTNCKYSIFAGHKN